MSSMSDRITSMVKSSDMSIRQLAKHLGVSNVSLSNWMRGETEPSEEGLLALCEFFSVTPAWVRYGDATALGGQTIELDDGTIMIPRLSAEAHCGTPNDTNAQSSGAGVELIEFMGVTPEWANKYCPTAAKKSIHIITATGDSMEPTLFRGDTVVIDVSQKSVLEDGIYAVRIAGQVMVKRLQITLKGLVLLSDNPLYQPMSVCEGDNLEIIGRAYAGLHIKKL